MKRLLLSLALISLLVVGCDSGRDTLTATQEATSAETIEGALPILEIGDKWISQSLLDDIEYTFTVEVVGEDIVDGNNCYVLEYILEPPVLGVATAIMKQDKVTLGNILIQIMPPSESFEETKVIEMQYSQNYSESPFPYEVGKSWHVNEIETTKVMVGEDITEKDDKWEYASNYEIEKIETITVPAGTFKCFKIMKYDEDESPMETYWRSDKVKLYDVKSYDYDTDVTYELISYSVSD